MDIVYFGSDVFLPCFEYLARRHRILALYTYHNDEDYFSEYGIVKRASDMGIPVFYGDVSPEDTKRYFMNGCGMYFVAEYDRIIEIPGDLPSFRGINIHSSALPQGRSYYPIEAAMDRGLTRTGVTMHKLKPRLDSGEIIAQRVFDILLEADSIDVYLRCSALALEMTEEVFADPDKAWNSSVVQKEILPYWKRPESGNMTLTGKMTSAEAAGIFRRYNSMTQVMLGGRWYFVFALQTGTEKLLCPEIRLADDRWLYGVSDGHIRLCVRPMDQEGI